MKTTIINSLKKKFINADGTLNKTAIASFITLLVVLVDQVLAAFGVAPSHQSQVIAIINTVLTILGLLGFVEGQGDVQDLSKKDENPSNSNAAQIK